MQAHHGHASALFERKLFERSDTLDVNIWQKYRSYSSLFGAPQDFLAVWQKLLGIEVRMGINDHKVAK
jgi:hypothetical protein